MPSSTTAWPGPRAVPPSRKHDWALVFMSRYKKNPGLNRVLVTGGAGYVGAVLVPKLLEAGYKVTVLDLYMYGEDVLKECRSNPGLREVKGDIRDGEVVKQALEGCDSVIHLACISNDPSF